jgi:hypothetical protein
MLLTGEAGKKLPPPLWGETAAGVLEPLLILIMYSRFEGEVEYAGVTTSQPTTLPNSLHLS